MMEANFSSKSKSSTVESESSAGNMGAFNLNDCGKALPKDTEFDSDGEEFSDAKGVNECESDDELELDEEALKDSHKNLSDDELKRLKDEAVKLKNEGNEAYKKLDYTEAVKLYTRALNICPLKYASDRAILFANRSAVMISLDKKEEAILDCNKAIELNPTYLKAILRRAQVFRKMDSLEKSLEDYQKVLELDPNNSEARKMCATMPAEISEKNEKLKEEMFGKLKELGNICLKPFGLSTDNFKVKQDPNSGGYSINFEK